MSTKPKVEGEKEHPPIVQCGIYGAEMLTRGPYATHAINLSIIDNCVWVWWYDRQGAIQSSGVDFVADLPYFLVLLAVFQRFTLQDGGIETRLVNEAEKHHRRIISSAGKYVAGEHPHHDREDFPFTCSAGTKVSVARSEPVYDRYSLPGRGTSMYKAKRGVPHGEELVMKIYWPEMERRSEVDILKAISKRRAKETISSGGMFLF
ncbi:hypothetical protein SCP_0706560 [Sparassis crispa]|uniref:Fungal-type protein kinase domain-containing protein n=1 Tax=Sparassis crispa TaxID=139825 RepID=A0A401GTG0_9APHY|nr:hypothetical protein SCP_0706560 [Sparassis crispa]GBE85469.1 hypothetical protein SCP_0706560 [Sparassis crispa]